MLRSMIPWRERFPVSLPKLDHEFDDLVEKFFGGNADQLGLTRFMPSLNVSETDAEYAVTAELAGMKPEDVHVEMKDGNLWISGDKQEEKEEKGKTFHRVERRHGEFRRVVQLPDAAPAEKVIATFEHGVLSIRIPKAEEVKPTRIPVTS